MADAEGAERAGANEATRRKVETSLAKSEAEAQRLNVGKGEVLPSVAPHLESVHRAAADNRPEDLQRAFRETEEETERLRTENRAILAEQNRLLEEERLKVILQLSGTVAHDLNQPLTAIVGYTGLLKLEQTLSPENQHILDQIEQSARRIKDIIEKIQRAALVDPQPYKAGAVTVRFTRLHRILLLEDESKWLHKFVRLLEPYREYLHFDFASTCDEAERRLKEQDYDLVIADYQVGDSTSLDFIGRPTLPIDRPPFIMVTGKGDEKLAVQAVRNGFYDYLPKVDLDREALVKAIWSTVERSRLEKELQSARARIAEMATADGLTGLHNRRYLMERFEAELARVIRYEHSLGVCMVDVDHFKGINDRYGHAMGDRVLQHLAGCLRKLLRKSDICGRYGGEEFLVLLPNTDLANARRFAERLRKKVADDKLSLPGLTIPLTVSVGVAAWKKGLGGAELLRLADEALYRAKNEGRDRVCIAEEQG
ncbi:MAG: diguanylate cyclase [Myxococcales bacterium]|nr:MAG: diguanylate cyclase [Myxococcales bacterium]